MKYYNIRAIHGIDNVIFSQTLTTKSYAIKKYNKLCEFYKGMGRRVEFTTFDQADWPTFDELDASKPDKTNK